MSRRMPFWEHVDKSGECWIWTGSKHSAGYGSTSVNAKRVYAHRYAYEVLVGPIPEGLVIDHLCRNRLCVRPDHLEPVTLAENTRRGATPFGPLHATCKRGHDVLNEENIYVAQGGKHCRQCARDRDNQRVRPNRGKFAYARLRARKALLAAGGAENEETRTYRDGEDDA